MVPRSSFKSFPSNTCYAVWDGDRGEGGAITESPISNARYAVADSDRGEGGAFIECITSNACYAVGSTIIGNSFGDCDSINTCIIRR